MMIRMMKAVRLLQPKPDLSKPLLVTIGTSHFAEKARWCLDLSPLRDEYVEQMHCPAFHLSSTLLALDPLPRVRTWRDESDPLSSSSSFAARLQQRHPRVKEKTGVPKLVLPASFLASHPQAAAVEMLSSKGAKLPLAPGADGTDGASGASGTSSVSGAGGSVVVQGGSAGVMRFLADLYPQQLGHLYPPADTALGQQVLDLDEQLDMELGPAATSWCFANMLLSGQDFYTPTPSSSSSTASTDTSTNSQSVQFMLRGIRQQDVPSVEKFLFCNFAPLLLPVMLRANNISASEKQRAKETIRALFSRMDELIRASRSRSGDSDSDSVSPFLLGTRQMTAADITFASLAAPILMPPQMDHLLPRFRDMEGVLGAGSGSQGQRDSSSSGSSGGAARPSLQAGCVDQADFARELRNKHISAQLCLHLYAHHRLPSSSPSSSPFSSPSSQRYDTRGEYDQLVISPAPAAGASSSSPQPAAAVVQPKTAQERARLRSSSGSSLLGRLVPQRARDPNSCRPER